MPYLSENSKAMTHSELPKWLRKSLPAPSHKLPVSYSEHEIARILDGHHIVGDVHGMEITVTARLDGRCWSCGGRYQDGTLDTYSQYTFTTSHIRRGNCRYQAESSGTRNPAVQVSKRSRRTLRLSAE